MCKVKSGHNYSDDAKGELGVGQEQWDRTHAATTRWVLFVEACIRYLPVILFAILLWGIRVELRLGPNGNELPTKVEMTNSFADLSRQVERLEAAQIRTNNRIDDFIRDTLTMERE